METVKEQTQAESPKHQITLTEKQRQIISGIFQAKQGLEQEFRKVLERESEFIINLCEAKGIEAVQGIEFKEVEGALIMSVPAKEETYTEKTKKKLKKVE